MNPSRSDASPAGGWTAHTDTYVRDRLPAAHAQPVFEFTLPELAYRDALNCAGELLDAAIVRGWADRTAIRLRDGAWTYRQLLDEANRFANWLTRDMGLEPGGRVLLRMANGPHLSALWLAAIKAGAVVVPTMPMLRAAELVPILEKSRPAIAVCAEPLLDDLRRAAKETQAAVRIASIPGASNAAARHSPAYETVRTHRDDPCLLAFTSGTTGKPKACVHFHRDVLAMADTFAARVLKADSDGTFLATPPLAFTFGLGGSLVFPMRIGAAAAFPDKPGVAALVAHIAELGVTTLFTAPTSYRQILEQRAADLSSLRFCVSAGEVLPKATSDAWFERTGLRLIDGIGATELMHIFISASGEAIRPGATGVPVPGYRAALLDEEDNELPGAATGRLAVRGPTGCRYLDDARQSAYVRKGWNVTGDIYRRDEDGYYWYVARADDMIISSGYNIAGPEVEAALLGHPAVAECAVVAHPDAERGHVPKAFVVLKAPVADEPALAVELQDFVKGAIAPYKYPRTVAFVPELPKTATGKIQRHRLRG